MEAPEAGSSRRLRLVNAAILAIGFGAAIAVYIVNRPRPDNPLGYDPLETKKYLHDLEMYGGKANVLAAEFRDWFASLWYGRNLAYTIAVLTVLLVGAVRFGVALRNAPLDDEDDHREAPREARQSGLRAVPPPADRGPRR